MSDLLNVGIFWETRILFRKSFLCLYLEVFFTSALNFKIYIKAFDPFGVVFVQWEIRELVSFFYM